MPHETAQSMAERADVTPAAREEIAAFLQTHAPFDQMASEDLVFLLKRLERRRYLDGAHITDPGHGPARQFVIILSGRVRGLAPLEDRTVIGLDPTGHEDNGSQAWELGEGECFPVGALLAHRPVHTTHQATGVVTTLELPAEDFHELVHRSSAFADFCTRRLSNLLDRVQRQLQADLKSDLTTTPALQMPVSRMIRQRQTMIPPGTPIRQVLRTLDETAADASVIGDERGGVAGVLTLRDVANRVALGEVPLDRPVSEVMTPDPVCIQATRPAFEAGRILAEHGFHHLVVVKPDGRLIGLLSETDLYRQQPLRPGLLSREIERTERVADLAAVVRQTPELAALMISQGASFSQTGQMISLINDQITRRIIKLRLEGAALPAGLRWAWLVFGSEARQEQTLATDQDNGIIFQAEGDPATARQALLALAERVNQDLATIGFPLCPGNIMARNPECCLTIEEWRQRFRHWIDQGTPEHLLKASIFFDRRHVHGDPDLLVEFNQASSRDVQRNSRFRKQMAANALRIRPPLGLFGHFKTQRRTLTDSHDIPHDGAARTALRSIQAIDLKYSGATPFVDSARIEALETGTPDVNTVARIEAMSAGGNDRQSWAAAYEFIQMLRLRRQLEQIHADRKPDNWIDPESLDELSQRILKEAFRQARKLQQRLSVHYQL